MVQDFVISPTAPPDARNHSDISLTNLFVATVQISNIEKQLIWHRYSAFLLANALVVSLLTSRAPQVPILIVACLFGLILCGLWWWVTTIGWTFLHELIRHGRRFTWEGEALVSISPMTVGLHGQSDRGRKDVIQWAATFVILLFIVAYVVLGVIALFNPTLILPD